MIAEIGHALLWLALGCAVLQAVAGLVPRAGLTVLAVPAALLGGWLWLWVLGALAWSFHITDLSVAGVAAASDAALPSALKYLGVLAAPGGGGIALAALVAWAGAALAFFRAGARAALGALGLAAIGATTIVLLCQTFARLVPAPTAGSGFPAVTRSWLAGIAPPGRMLVDAPYALGQSGNGVELVAVTPVAGPDSTGVLAEVRIGGATLLPEWRETVRPRAAFAVSDSGRDGGDWVAATIRPESGRWRVTATRLPLWPAAALLLGLAALLWWRRR